MSVVDTAGKKKVFIDGEAGTTGLQVRDRLAAREDLEIVSISDELRKDVGERKRLINEADCVILCEFRSSVPLGSAAFLRFDAAGRNVD